MYSPKRPKRLDIVILVLAIAVIVAVELAACGIAGWSFYRYVVQSKATPTAVGVSQTMVPEVPTSASARATVAVPGPTSTVTPTPTATSTSTTVPTNTPTPTMVPTNTPTPMPALPVADFVPEPGQRWVLVDLSEQRLYAYEGTELFLESACSTGTEYHPTVEGQYRVYLKLVAARMTGPGYDLPGVPFTMYFYRGYGIHGTYWHENFGHPMSHGCINLPTPVAEKLFWWAGPTLPEGANAVWANEENPGTLVVIQP